MTGPVFVDTNVFVYLHDDSAPAKKLRANDWITYLVSAPHAPESRATPDADRGR